MKNLLIEHLSKCIGSKVILDNITISCNSHNIYGLIGNNGAGKTTLFQSILGLTHYVGKISIDDFVINKDNTRDYVHIIGMVTPFPDDYDKLTVDELLKDHHYYMGVQKSLDTAGVLTSVGLHIQESTKVKELSLGMKQRLNLALALLHNPDILLLDEPFNGLDREGIAMLKTIIKRYIQKDRLVLIASHAFAELQDIVDSVIVLDKGKIIGQTKTQDLDGYFTNLLIDVRKQEARVGV